MEEPLRPFPDLQRPVETDMEQGHGTQCTTKQQQSGPVAQAEVVVGEVVPDGLLAEEPG